jgi:hypothetical protein
MSTYSLSQYYPSYKKSLAEYSQCIKPILEAAYEKHFIYRDTLPYDLNEYCVEKRELVEKFRGLIKSENL